MFKRRLSLFLTIIMVLQVLYVPSTHAQQYAISDTPAKVQLEHRSFTNGFNLKASPCLYPWFKLTNTSQKDLSFEDLEIRYYYTKDGTNKQVFNCDWVTIGSRHVKGSFHDVKLPTEKANTYLNIAFKKSAGRFKQGQTIELHGRLWDSMWANYDQTNDHSFHPNIDTYNTWNRVVVLHKGEVIWGIEPLGKLDAPKLQIQQKDYEANLIWDPVRGAEEYIVKKRSALGDYEVLEVLKNGETTYSDKIVNDQTYYYTVQAKTDNIFSPEAEEVAYYGKPKVPHLSGSREGNDFRLQWNNGETTYYNIYRAEAVTGPFELLAGNVTGYTYVDRLQQDKTYYYTITAVNPLFESGRSNVVKREVEAKDEHIFNPQKDDDGDGLTNDEELYYGTNVYHPDTDGDDFTDKEEVDTGTDPLVINPYTITQKEVPMSAGKFELKVEGDKAFQQAPLSIKTSDNAVLNAMKGLVGEPIEITAGGYSFYNAKLTFNYDETKLEGASENELTIFYVNPKTKKLEPLRTYVDTQRNIAFAYTDHFSTYLLGDKDMPIDLTNVDLVFVIDQSGSMNWNDSHHYRLDATKKFVDSMNETKFKIGLVGFHNSAFTVSDITSDKERLTQALNTLRYAEGGTHIASGIHRGAELFKDDGQAKVMILLSDGDPTDGDAWEAANYVKDKVVINSIALGKDAAHQLMRDVATITNGAYFYINNSDNLTYEDVKHQMDTIYTKLIKQLSFNEIIVETPEVEKKPVVLPFDKTLLGVDSIPAKEWLIYGDSNLLTGNWLTQQVDLQSKVLPFGLTYNSLSEEVTSVGRGFKHSYDSKVVIEGERMTVHYPTGTVVTFNKTQDGSYRSIHSGDTLYLKDGKVTLRKPNQEEWGYRADGKLDYQLETTGLKKQMSYDGDKLSKVTHTKGHTLSFTYQGDLLQEVKDHTGRTVTYTYDDKKLTKTVAPKDSTREYYYNTNQQIELVVNDGGVLVARNEYDKQKRIIRQYDAKEHVRYTFYDDGRNTRYYIDENGYEHKVVYNTMWKKLLQRDAYGNQESHSYSYKDQMGNWQSLDNLSTDSDAYKTYSQGRYTGDMRTQVTSVDKMGHKTVTELNNKGQILQTANPLGQVSTFQYDKWGNVTKQTALDGGITTYTYDDSGRKLMKAINPLGYEEQYTYYTPEEVGIDGLLKEKRDAQGNRYTYGYDATSYECISMIDPLGNKTTYTYDERGNKTSVTLPNGAKTESTYDENNNVTKVIKPRGLEVTYTYDAYNNLTKEVTKDGPTITYAYNNLNQLEKKTYDDGTTETFTYTPTGEVETITNRLGHTTTYLYDAQDRKIAIIDPLGNENRFKYNANDQLIKETGKNKAEQSFEYDPLGRVVKAVDAKGHATTYEYNVIQGQGMEVITTNPEGHKTRIKKDLLGRDVESIDAQGYTRKNEYDALGNVSRQVEPRGYETRYRYDALGRVIETIDAKDGIQTQKYDTVGNVIEKTNPLGGKTVYTYDLENNCTTIEDSMGSTVKKEYDLFNREIKTIDALGYTVEKGYDKEGRLVKEANQLGHVTTYSYDALGNLKKQVNPLKEETNFTYDPLGNLTKQVAADDSYVSYSYDAVGNRIGKVDARGYKTTYTYDLMGNQTSVITPDGVATHYTYDALGQLVATTDGKGNKTESIYDALGRVIKTINQLGHTEELVYDAVGNKLSKTDGEGHKTYYTYDANNNLQSVTLPDGTTTKYTYNAMNLLTVQTDEGGHTLQYTYDLLGRETARIDNIGQVQTITYDERGNKEEVKDRKGQVTTYTYDGQGKLIEEKVVDEVLSYTYDPLGRLISETRGDKTTGYTYDQVGNTTQILYPDGRAAQYAYDTARNKVLLIDPLGNRMDYTYDENNRMKEVKYADILATYTYDANGNRTAIDFSTGASVNYTFDTANRLIGMESYLLSEEQIKELEKLEIIPTLQTTSEALTVTTSQGLATTTGPAIDIPLTTEQALQLKQKPRVDNTYSYDNRGLLIRKTEDG